VPQAIDSSQPGPVGDVAAELGEGPLWNTWGPDGPAGATLQWVDIPGGKLYRTVPSSGQTLTVDLGAPVSAVLPVADGRVIVSRRDRLVVIETDGTERTLARVSLPHAARFNDGAPDPPGRAGIGSTCTRGRPARGPLYRLDPRGA